MVTQKIYKTIPKGYSPEDVARNAKQARNIQKSAINSGMFSDVKIVKTGKQNKKGNNHLTYTIYGKEKRK